MKTFSKIASLVLALIMLFTICIVPTSAAGDTELDIKYVVEKNAEKSAASDTYDFYNVTVSIKAGKNAVAMLNLPIFYDKTIFQPLASNSGGTNDLWEPIGTAPAKKYPKWTGLGELAYRTTDAADADGYYLTGDGVYDPDNGFLYPAGCGTSSLAVNTYTTNFGTIDQDKYALLMFSYEYEQDVRYLCANGVEVPLFTTYFCCAKGTDATGAVFGYPDGATAGGNTFDTTGQTYFVQGCKFETGTSNYTNATVEASFKIEHAQTQIQWANKAEGKLNIGFKGQFTAEDIDIAWDEGVRDSKNVTAVGVELDNAEKKQYTTNTVYTNDGGVTYQFRAVVTDAPYTSEDTIRLRYFVVLDGETIYSDYVETTAKAQYERVIASKPDFAV